MASPSSPAPVPARPPTQALYFAFLLRLWQAGGDQGRIWHASLENPHSGEKLGFGGLAQLQAYLRRLTEPDEHTGAAPVSGDSDV